MRVTSPTGAAIRARPVVPIMVSSLVVIFAVFELLLLPFAAQHFLYHEPMVAGAWMARAPLGVWAVTDYLGNRPRPMGVVEKCTFCIQRSRNGRYPACVEICPVGARKFGNLLDPESEIRQVMDRKRVFVFKEELATEPQFYFFYAT